MRQQTQSESSQITHMYVHMYIYTRTYVRTTYNTSIDNVCITLEWNSAGTLAASSLDSYNTYRHMYMYMYIYTRIYTHTHIYIYICTSIQVKRLTQSVSNSRLLPHLPYTIPRLPWHIFPIYCAFTYTIHLHIFFSTFPYHSRR